MVKKRSLSRKPSGATKKAPLSRKPKKISLSRKPSSLAKKRSTRKKPSMKKPLTKKHLKGKTGIYRSSSRLYSADLAKSYLSLARGLMFRKVAPLVLEFPHKGNWGIWMLFMRDSIDLVFLDERRKVVSVHKDLNPLSLDPSTWRIYYPPAPVKYAIELPAGTTIQPGNTLVFR